MAHGGLGFNSLTAGYIPFGNSATALTSSSNLFYSTASVRLGVGTASPVATVHIRGGNSNNLTVDNDGSQYTTVGWFNNGTEKAQAYFDATNILFVMGTDVASPFIFKTNTFERMRISGNTGGVSVGTTTEAGAGNILVNGGYKTTNFTIIEETGVLNFYYGSTKIASLDNSGNFTTIANITAYGTP